MGTQRHARETLTYLLFVLLADSSKEEKGYTEQPINDLLIRIPGPITFGFFCSNFYAPPTWYSHPLLPQVFRMEAWVA